MPHWPLDRLPRLEISKEQSIILEMLSDPEMPARITLLSLSLQTVWTQLVRQPRTARSKLFLSRKIQFSLLLTWA